MSSPETSILRRWPAPAPRDPDCGPPPPVRREPAPACRRRRRPAAPAADAEHGFARAVGQFVLHSSAASPSSRALPPRLRRVLPRQTPRDCRPASARCPQRLPRARPSSTPRTRSCSPRAGPESRPCRRRRPDTALFQIFLGALGRFVRISRQAGVGKAAACGSSTGSLPSRTLRNSNCGTCRPSTTRQTVSGVDRSSPTGPQSQVQKIAATMMASGERPVREPYSQGSMTLLLISSRR